MTGIPELDMITTAISVADTINNSLANYQLDKYNVPSEYRQALGSDYSVLDSAKDLFLTGNGLWGKATMQKRGDTAVSNIRNNSVDYSKIKNNNTLLNSFNADSFQTGVDVSGMDMYTPAGRNAQRINDAVNNANRAQMNSFNNTALNNAQQQSQNFLKTYYAQGGQMPGLNNFAVFNGPTHESNPYGGIQQGIAPDGQPNLVEGEEVKYSFSPEDEYIFSNRIKITNPKKFNLPENYKGLTFAEGGKKYIKDNGIEERHDPVTKQSADEFFARMRDHQEDIKQRRLQRKLQQAFMENPELFQQANLQPTSQIPMAQDEGMQMDSMMQPQEEQTIPQENEAALPQYALGGHLFRKGGATQNYIIDPLTGEHIYKQEVPSLPDEPGEINVDDVEAAIYDILKKRGSTDDDIDALIRNRTRDKNGNDYRTALNDLFKEVQKISTTTPRTPIAGMDVAATYRSDKQMRRDDSTFKPDGNYDLSPDFLTGLQGNVNNDNTEIPEPENEPLLPDLPVNFTEETPELEDENFDTAQIALDWAFNNPNTPWANSKTANNLLWNYAIGQENDATSRQEREAQLVANRREGVEDPDITSTVIEDDGRGRWEGDSTGQTLGTVYLEDLPEETQHNLRLRFPKLNRTPKDKSGKTLIDPQTVKTIFNPEYAPIFGSVLNVLGQALQHPQYNLGNAYRRNAAQLNPVGTPFFGQYQNYNPYDVNVGDALNAAQYNAAQANVRNNGNAASQFAQQMALNAQTQQTNALRNLSAQEANNKAKQATITSNNALDAQRMANIRADEQMNNAILNKQLDLLNLAAKADDAEDTLFSENRSKALTNLFNTIGNYGKDKWNRQQTEQYMDYLRNKNNPSIETPINTPSEIPTGRRNPAVDANMFRALGFNIPENDDMLTSYWKSQYTPWGITPIKFN